MKGVIFNALKEMMEEKFGKEKWESVLAKSGIEKETSVLATDNILDERIIRIINSICGELKIDLKTAGEAFGEYWMCHYAPKIYSAFFVGANSAKDFLLKMDKVHLMVTQNIEGANPPRFEYEWLNDKTLLMTYKSKRNLMEIFVGLVKGVGKYYKENLDVTSAGRNKVRIIFS